MKHALHDIGIEALADIDTPLGAMTALATSAGLAALWFDARERYAAQLADARDDPAHPHIAAARRLRHLLAKYNKARDLIQLGAYQAGNDAELDTAVRLQAPMNALLQQDMHERSALDMSRAQLCRLMPS